MTIRTLLLLLLCMTFVSTGCESDDDDAADDDDTGDDDDDETGDDDDDDDDNDDDDDDTIPELRGGCDLATKIGTFQVQHETDYSSVYGEVADGVVPVTVLENVLDDGTCRLLKRNNPFCDPPCDPGFTCDFDGSCIPYPLPQDAGTVSIDGLEKEVEMVFPNYWDTQMPHPPFTPGAAIHLNAAGATVEPFTLHGEGLTPIEIDEEETWIVRDGEELTVNWTPANEEHTHIRLQFNIDQHGNTPITLFCDLDDTGTYNVSVEMLEGLIGNGVSGFPSGKVYRQTLDSVEIDGGCVEFQVYSHIVGNLQVEGHIPCDEPDDCPEGMECDYATNTCI